MDFGLMRELRRELTLTLVLVLVLMLEHWTCLLGIGG